ETVAEEGLRDGDVRRLPVLPLALVVAIHQLVVEIEDRRIGERHVGVILAAGQRALGVIIERGDGPRAGKLDATDGAVNIAAAVYAERRADRGILRKDRRGGICIIK